MTLAQLKTIVDKSVEYASIYNEPDTIDVRIQVDVADEGSDRERVSTVQILDTDLDFDIGHLAFNLVPKMRLVPKYYSTNDYMKPIYCLDNAMRCPRCHSKVGVRYNFCAICGQRIKEAIQDYGTIDSCDKAIIDETWDIHTRR